MSREGIEPPSPPGTCFTDRLDYQLSGRLGAGPRPAAKATAAKVARAELEPARTKV